MKRDRSVILFSGLLLLLGSGRALGQSQVDDTVLVVGGYAGSWDTELLITNTNSAAVQGVVQAETSAGGQPCPISCPTATFNLPGHGTARLSARSFLGTAEEGPRNLRITTFLGLFFIAPTVQARLVNTASPAQSTDLPVVAETAVDALNSTDLFFPGAQRSSTAHSNLILTRVNATSSSFSVLVQAFSSDGVLLGGGQFTAPEGAKTLFLVDVLSQLGVSAVTDGSIQVTRVSGDGGLWGLLATSFADGRVTVSTGGSPR